jgi:mannose-6-phosphate isomerase-like protein (cupin superfamily)
MSGAEDASSASQEPVAKPHRPPRNELAWSRRGQVVTNPVTGERVLLLTDPETHPDRTLVAHLFVRLGGRVAAPHVHPVATERFHVLAGRVGFQVGGRQRVLQAGESYEVPPRIVHDWWQIGTEEAQVLVEVTPGERFVGVIGTTFGLARDGHVDARGLPHLLQAAVSPAPAEPGSVTACALRGPARASCVRTGTGTGASVHHPAPLPPPPLPSTVAPLPPTELIPGVTCGLLGLRVCPTG